MEAGQKSTDECLKNLPDAVMCLNVRGNYYLGAGDDPELALEAFSKMEDLNGKAGVRFHEGLIHVGIAQSQERLQQLELAFESYERACRFGQAYACTRAKQMQNEPSI